MQGNIIRGNTITGNPPVQVAVDHTSNGGFDIKYLADAGANLFVGNVCLSGLNAPCPTIVVTLESELQSLGCGTRPPVPSCQLTVSQWNSYLLNLDPTAKALVIGDGTKELTVQQYLQARKDAGL